MIKLTGIALIVVFCSMNGIALSQKLQYRVRTIEMCISFLKALCDELKYTLAPVDELFLSLGKREEYTSLDFIFSTLNSMSGGDSFQIALKTSIDKTTLECDTEDKRILKNLGDLLGATDLEGQINGISHIEMLMNEQLSRAKSKSESHGRIYRTLGVLSGLTIGIILI